MLKWMILNNDRNRQFGKHIHVTSEWGLLFGHTQKFG